MDVEISVVTQVSQRCPRNIGVVII